MGDHLMRSYARFAVEFSRGDGAWLWDTGGKRYLDALSGLAVCGLGHAPPVLFYTAASNMKRRISDG